jgi:hypothetical protein
MKRILSLLLTLTLVATFFALGQAEVEAEAVSTCTTNQTVFVHYNNWSGTYTDTTIWSWGAGTNGTADGHDLFGEDDFGAIYQICVDDDASDELGLILKYGAGWSGDDFTDRDGLDLDADGNKDNKSILVKENDAFVGFTDGVKHVYVFEGMADVLYDAPFSDDMATIAVIYYDVTQSYDGWGIHTWGTGTDGSAPDWGTPVPIVGSLGVDGGESADYRILFLEVNPTDASDTIGFILTNGADKKFDGDMSIDVSALEAGDFMTTFYIAGESMLRTTFADMEAAVNLFEIDSATALDPNSVEVVFNKEVITKEDDVITFDPANFTLEDKDGNAVVISQVSFNSTADVNDTFTLITETALMGSASPYMVTYTNADMEEFTAEVVVESDAPVITILGPTETTLELGDTYSLPNYFATDTVGEETVDIYNVRVKDGAGTVDTRNAGIYEVVITASDKFGNVAEATITVTVTDPCDEDAHLSANSNVGLISLLVGLPIAFGAIITMGRKY